MPLDAGSKKMLLCHVVVEFLFDEHLAPSSEAMNVQGLALHSELSPAKCPHTKKCMQPYTQQSASTMCQIASELCVCAQFGEVCATLQHFLFLPWHCRTDNKLATEWALALTRNEQAW